jgi:hypothetical protein
MDSIQEELDSTDWRTELSRRPMEAAWTYFRERLEKAIETHVPSGTHRTRLKNPWMTREILRLVRQKRRRWQALKRSPTKENEEEYRRIEKETSNKIRNA